MATPPPRAASNTLSAAQPCRADCAGSRAQQTRRAGVDVEEASLSVALLACPGLGPRLSTIFVDVASDGVITSWCPEKHYWHVGSGWSWPGCQRGLGFGNKEPGGGPFPQA